MTNLFKCFGTYVLNSKYKFIFKYLFVNVVVISVINKIQYILYNVKSMYRNPCLLFLDEVISNQFIIR